MSISRAAANLRNVMGRQNRMMTPMVATRRPAEFAAAARKSKLLSLI